MVLCNYNIVQPGEYQGVLMNNTKKVTTNQQVPQNRNDEKACSVENN